MPEHRKLVFATFFPGCENVHLIKDVGMIPYIMHRDYSYDSYLICYDRDDYTHLKDLPGLQLLFMKGRQSRLFNDRDVRPGPYWFVRNWIADKIDVFFTLVSALPLMLKRGRDIDVLQLYHFKYETLVIGLLYRLVNRKGLLYLKLDTDPAIVDFYKENFSKLKNPIHLSHFLFRLLSFDMISVESKKLYDFLTTAHPLYSRFKDNIYHLPNGVDIGGSFATDFREKQNVVLHVARMGAPEKRSEIAVTAFSRICKEYQGWKLILLGSMNEGFKKYYSELIQNDVALGKSIIYAGFITDREELYGYYRKAKIILIPSLYEGFPIAAIEAGEFGDVVLGSDIPSLREMTDDGTLGYLCPVYDVSCFEKRLRYLFEHENELAAKSSQMSRRVRDVYDIRQVCSKLDGIIRNRLG